MFTLLRHRPALVAGLALVVGIALHAYLPTEALLAGCAACILMLFLGIRYPGCLLPASVLGLIAFGALAESAWESSFTESPLVRLARFAPEDARLTGVVEESETVARGRRWLFTCDSVALRSGRSIPMHGSVLVWLPPLPDDSLEIDVGSYVTIFANLEPFRSPTNPFEYAAEEKLQRETGASIEAYVRSNFDCYVRSDGTRDSRYARVVDAARAFVTRELDSAVVDTESRAFVKAVVLGERNELSQADLDAFSASGISHILSVSGFNVAIIALVIAQLLRLLGLSKLRVRTIVSMLGVLGYAALVGVQPSVVRALVMIECYYLAILLERRPDPLNVVAGAAALELLIRPFDLYDVGFQLSYSAVLGLVMIYPRLKSALEEMLGSSGENADTLWERGGKRVLETLLLSFAALLASYPVLASHFYRVSFIGLVTNVIAVPLSSVLTALGFLLVPLNWASAYLGRLYGDAISFLTHILFSSAKLAAAIPSGAHAAAPPNALLVIAYVLAVLYVVAAPNSRRLFARASVAVIGLAVLFALPLPLTRSVLAEGDGKLQVLFFDVGQGDCTLLRTPSGKIYLIDFGTLSRSGISRASRTLVPFLRAEDRSVISAGFLSHMHLDHFGGLPDVLRGFAVRAFYSSGERERDRHATELDSLARVTHLSEHVLARGDELKLDTEVVLTVLHPGREAVRKLHCDQGEHMNDGSLVFRVSFGRTSVLFLGDIEQQDEEEMMDEYGPLLRSDVVKVAHHGSLTSSSRGFVRVVRASYAIVSVGEHNRFGHPAPVVLRRWMDAGSVVKRTDRDGAILLESDGEHVQERNWR